jgi:hypothetical protein
LQALLLQRVGSQEDPIRLQDLPNSLVELRIESSTISSISSSSSSEVSMPAANSSSGDSWQLTNLQQVFLNSVDCNPAVLGCMRGMTLLCWYSYELQWMQDVLPVLLQLQQLQDLVLNMFLGEADAELYAALTASTQLRSLELVGCWMAATAAQYMFADGQSLPYLTKLCIRTHELWPHMADADSEWREGLDVLLEESLGVGPADVARLVQCCPNLQELRMLVLSNDVTCDDVASLLQLTSLTYLGVDGAGCTDAVAEQLLWKLTGKQRTQLKLFCFCCNAVVTHVICGSRLEMLETVSYAQYGS